MLKCYNISFVAQNTDISVYFVSINILLYLRLFSSGVRRYHTIHINTTGLPSVAITTHPRSRKMYLFNKRYPNQLKLAHIGWNVNKLGSDSL